MAKLFLRKEGSGQKRGFSLIVVLIISLVGLAAVGAVMQFVTSSAGSGRVSSAQAVKYKLLQDALEEGRAILRQSMDNTGAPHSYLHKDGIDDGTLITSSGMLLLTDSPSPTEYPGVDFPLGNAITRNLSKRDLERVGVFGDSGVLTVRIYDMLYDPKSVAPVGTGAGQISPEELQLMPPAMSLLGEDDFEVLSNTDAPDYERSIGHGLTTNNAGAYLVRASLSVPRAGGAPPHTWSIETSVVQSNNM